MARHDDIPLGLCGCGCGQRTKIATCSDRHNNWIKGQPKRFIYGHNRKSLPIAVTPKSYKSVSKSPGRPGSMYLHRERAKQAAGHELPARAVIHHPDHDGTNPSARLVICEDQAYHMLLHARERIVRAGGNPNTDKLCGTCHRVKPRTAFCAS